MVDAPKICFRSFDLTYPVGRQDRHYHLYRIFSLELKRKLCYSNHKKSTHSMVDAPGLVLPLKMRGAHSVCRRGGHYFLCLFLLSRKASNAMTKLPKDISKPIIPINIKMISAALMCITSFLCIPANWFPLAQEATTLSWVLFRNKNFNITYQ
jgi:hypothetical protein